MFASCPKARLRRLGVCGLVGDGKKRVRAGERVVTLATTGRVVSSVSLKLRSNQWIGYFVISRIRTQFALHQ
jgi:hypothetical protein